MRASDTSTKKRSASISPSKVSVLAPPDNPDVRALHFTLRLIYVCDTLPEVELSIFLRCAALNLDERGVWPGVTLATLVAEDAALRVQPRRRTGSVRQDVQHDLL